MIRRFALLVALTTACDVNVRHIAVVFPQTGDWVGDRMTLAAGLDTFVVVRIEAISGAEHTYSEPHGLIVLADTPDAIEIEELGPVGFDIFGEAVDPDSEERHGALLRLHPLAEGDNRLRFLADQVDESDTIVVSGVVPEQVRFERAWGATEEVDQRLATFSRRADVTPTVVRGSAVLLAEGPLELASPETDSITGPPVGVPWLQLTDARHTAVVTVPGVAGSLSVTVATLDDIAGIGVDVDLTELAGSSVTIGIGERVELRLSPITADGLTIEGLPPEPGAALSGASAEMTTQLGSSLLWLEGVASGVSTLTLTWGTASRQIDVMVP